MIRSDRMEKSPDDRRRSSSCESAWACTAARSRSGRVARLMLFPASDESRYRTGGVYMVGGGISAR